MAYPNVSEALEEARKLVADLEAFDGSPNGHLAAARQAERIRTALRDPIQMLSHLIEQLSLAGAFNTILSIKAYQATPEDGSPIAVEKLAEATNVAPTMIQRTYRVAASHGVFVETAPDTFAHNDLSRALNPKTLGAVWATHLEAMRGWVHLPDYLKSHKPEDAYDPAKSLGAYSFGKEHLGKTWFELLELDPDPQRRETFDTAMTMFEDQMSIQGIFPFASLKEQVEQDPERPFLVDIGGGKGQSCFAIQQEIGEAFEGRFILQDLPRLINGLNPEVLSGIEIMAYDAFTPQPIKNAHIYFMRRFLHDFYAPDCIKIVQNTASAMGPDSRLLVCDMLIPGTVQPYEDMELYWMDMGLMCVGGQEKKMEELRMIVQAAGLEVVEVHHSSLGQTVMIEARLRM